MPNHFTRQERVDFADSYDPKHGTFSYLIFDLLKSRSFSERFNKLWLMAFMLPTNTVSQ